MTAHCKCDRSSPTSGIGAGGDAKGCANFNDICIKEGGKCARIDQFKTAKVQGPETCATQCMLKPGCKVRTHARILARARWEMMRGRRRWGRGHVPRGNGGPNTVTSLLCVERASHGGTIGGIPRPSLRLPRTIRACRAMAYGLAQGFELGASGSSMFCVFWTGASDPPMALLSTHGYLPAKWRCKCRFELAGCMRRVHMVPPQ